MKRQYQSLIISDRCSPTTIPQKTKDDDEGNVRVESSGDCYSRETNILVTAIPKLLNTFVVKQKIGEGSFSCVYLAKFRDSSTIPDQKSYVALKHIVPTTHPNRIVMELECMQRFGGHSNVMGILSCLREGCHVVMVMPYFPHDQFVSYVGLLDLVEIRDYIQKLLEALNVVHLGGVIHRDVKPSNFLYNRQLKRYALVDFGLSQKVTSMTSESGSCLDLSSTESKKKGKQGNEGAYSKTIDADWPVSSLKSGNAFVKLVPTRPTNASPWAPSHLQLTIRSSDSTESTLQTNEPKNNECVCYGRPQICRRCLAKPIQYAARAGTSGFRPPEVLLKHPRQTTAVDIWAAGVIMLSLISGRYPFFHASDDTTALAEIISLFGADVVKNAAAKLGKVVHCSPDNQPGIELESLVLQLRPSLSQSMYKNCQIWNSAFNLLQKLLEVDAQFRISASEALKHPFFSTCHDFPVDASK